jgi:hypothetical protein
MIRRIAVAFSMLQRREDSNLDRRLGLCAGGDRSQASRARDESLANPTDFQHHLAREMAISCVLEAFDSRSGLLDNSKQLILFDI